MTIKNPFDDMFFVSDELREMGFKSVGENVQIAKSCKIFGLSNIAIGDNVRIDSGVTLVCTNGSLKMGS